jgi:hypothetical protein
MKLLDHISGIDSILKFYSGKPNLVHRLSAERFIVARRFIGKEKDADESARYKD